jgi:hypothetical protein
MIGFRKQLPTIIPAIVCALQSCRPDGAAQLQLMTSGAGMVLAS